MRFKYRRRRLLTVINHQFYKSTRIKRRVKMSFTLDFGVFKLIIFMSFGECLFLHGVIRKIPKETHMLDLHRENSIQL
jgi:hypothetical protein